MMTGKPQRYAITGMSHRGTEDFVKSLPPDEPLTLVREPDNKYDRNAIAVWARGRHVGYIPKAQNGVLARFIDERGKVWTAPAPVVPLDQAIATDQTVQLFKALDARLHKGSNTWPLVEIV